MSRRCSAPKKPDGCSRQRSAADENVVYGDRSSKGNPTQGRGALWPGSNNRDLGCRRIAEPWLTLGYLSDLGECLGDLSLDKNEDW